MMTAFSCCMFLDFGPFCSTGPDSCMYICMYVTVCITVCGLFVHLRTYIVKMCQGTQLSAIKLVINQLLLH